ncbi:MAG: hypothetical protein M9958_11045 [Chitinophagales bacterium]|nr:hypothetical protein [Chitinophagales bacterium]
MRSIIVALILLCSFQAHSQSANDTYEDIYEESSVAVAEDVDEDFNPINEQISYDMEANGKQLVIIISNSPNKLETQNLYIDIFQRPLNSDKDETLIATLKLPVKPDWENASIKYNFTIEGDYVIDVTNEEGDYVNTGYFTLYKQ